MDVWEATGGREDEGVITEGARVETVGGTVDKRGGAEDETVGVEEDVIEAADEAVDLVFAGRITEDLLVAE